MEQLLEVENLEEALSGSLEIIVNELNSEAGAIWLLDTKKPSFPCLSDRRRYFAGPERHQSGSL